MIGKLYFVDGHDQYGASCHVSLQSHESYIFSDQNDQVNVYSTTARTPKTLHPHFQKKKKHFVVIYNLWALQAATLAF